MTRTQPHKIPTLTSQHREGVQRLTFHPSDTCCFPSHLMFNYRRYLVKPMLKINDAMNVRKQNDTCVTKINMIY